MTTDAVVSGERRVQHERRVERSRRTLELLLDTVFRPGHWAASLSYALGLQGRIQVSTSIIGAGDGARRARPLRVAFASDFHAGATTDSRMLARACEALAELQPDVLLLGGDFVSVRASYVHRLAPLIAGIPAPFGKFAVLGNHDLRANRAEVIAALEDAGVTMVANRSVSLAAPFERVTISGLDDPTRGRPRADWSEAKAEPGATRIVLMHSPDGLHAIGDRPFDLAVCGHTHGGQVTLPNGTALVVPSGTLSRRFCRGVFRLGEGARTLLVSRGVGCSTIPVRLFAAPEVHLCLIT
ncbi:MAG TPA: metallophosphoesterase [Gemmatimonadaceae bacterium]|nr:metallophosphoesterase [Gemmatimonadaceae bacterium]